MLRQPTRNYGLCLYPPRSFCASIRFGLITAPEDILSAPGAGIGLLAVPAVPVSCDVFCIAKEPDQ